MWNSVKTGFLFAAVRLAVFALFALVQLASPEASFLSFLDVPAFILVWGCSALFGVPQGIKDLRDPWFLGAAMVAWFLIGCVVEALRRQELFSSAPK